MLRKTVQRVIKHIRRIDNNRTLKVVVKRDSLTTICRRGPLHCICGVSNEFEILLNIIKLNKTFKKTCILIFYYLNVDDVNT